MAVSGVWERDYETIPDALLWGKNRKQWMNTPRAGRISVG